MNRLTNEQRLQIIEFYYQNQCSVRNVFRALRPIYGLHNRPSEQTINAIVTKFRTHFTLLDIKPTTRMRTVRTEENIASVSESVAEDREMSIRRRSQQLGLCYSTSWKILRENLGVKQYKIQLVQELKPNDLPQRRIFSEWALEKLAENPLFYRQILFSDEAHFWLNGYVNKQNCRIWSEEQPEAVQELPMHPEKCTVWCGLYAGGIIGPYFFKDAVGRNVTVNGDRYRSMLTNFLLPKMEELNLVDMWFQQDGATCHTARDSMAILRENFGEQFISRNGPVSWPPRSCDLTPLDYFLWGYVKSKVYRNKPATIPALEDNISEEIRAIPAEMLEKVAQNWTFRMDHLRRSRGQHLNEIIFKK
uniref:Putative transposable element n=3 Tax=Haematobia irritans TaxID=7368 RepID=A0A1L8EI80_HAEIR